MTNPLKHHTTALLYASLVVVGVLAGALATVLISGAGTVLPDERPRVEVVQLGARSAPGVVLRGDSSETVGYLDALSLNEAFKRVSSVVTPSVVFIEVESNRGSGFFHRFNRNGGISLSAGSGVIISEAGYVVTNHHVIEGATDIRVTLQDKREFEAEIVGEDPNTDLAVIRLTGAKDLPAVVLGEASSVQVGEWVLAVGNPFRLTSTVTAGIVSALGRQVDIIDNQLAIETFIQTDAAINPGNSGGALVNLRGELVGVATAIATESGSYEGYGFAVPVDLMQRVVSDLVEYGEVQRGYLGVTIEAVNAALADQLGMDRVRGVFLRDVRRGMASWEAGMRAGDVLIAIDGRSVDEPNELQGAIALYRPGDLVHARVWREGREFTVDVELFGRGDDRATEWFAELDNSAVPPDSGFEVPPDAESPHGNVRTLEAWGLGLIELSPRIATAFSVEEGVYVMFVEKDSPSDEAGLPRNAVITSVDGTGVSSVEEMAAALDAAARDQIAILLEVVRRDGSIAFFEVTPPPAG